jgi:hypothetical protein
MHQFGQVLLNGEHGRMYELWTWMMIVSEVQERNGEFLPIYSAFFCKYLFLATSLRADEMRIPSQSRQIDFERSCIVVYKLCENTTKKKKKKKKT